MTAPAANTGQALVQALVLNEERDVLDEYKAATGLTRAQIFRAMIHLLPEVGERLAEVAADLPERPADRAKRENAKRATAAWVAQHR